MRILVTGADGFVGKHLCGHLHERGDEVIEVRGPGVEPNGVDLLDLSALRAVVARAKPEGIVHLAGVSFVGESHAAPGRTFEVNAVGTTNLLDCVRHEASGARVLLVASGEVYGNVPEGARAAEDWPLRPTSPYSASKVAAEVVGFQFLRSYGLQVISARSFNHLGLGQAERFVVPCFARQLRDIREHGRDPEISVGDLSPIRDFSHVQDVVTAYRLLLERGVAGEAYNVASGEGRTVRDILDELIRLAGIRVKIDLDPSRIRPTEIPRLVGDPSKLRALGWTPAHSVSEALREVLEGRATSPEVG